MDPQFGLQANAVCSTCRPHRLSLTRTTNVDNTWEENLNNVSNKGHEFSAEVIWFSVL